MIRLQAHGKAATPRQRYRLFGIGFATCAGLAVLVAVTAQAGEVRSNALGSSNPTAIYEGSLIAHPQVKVGLQVFRGGRAVLQAEDVPALCDDGSQQVVSFGRSLDALGKGLFDGGEVVPGRSGGPDPLFIQLRARTDPKQRASGFIFYSIVPGPGPGEYRPECSTGLLRWKARRTS